MFFAAHRIECFEAFALLDASGDDAEIIFIVRKLRVLRGRGGGKGFICIWILCHPFRGNERLVCFDGNVAKKTEEEIMEIMEKRQNEWTK